MKEIKITFVSQQAGGDSELPLAARWSSQLYLCETSGSAPQKFTLCPVK